MSSNPGRAFLIFSFSKNVEKIIFGQILQNLKILIRWKYFRYNVLLSTLISKCVQYRFKTFGRCIVGCQLLVMFILSLKVKLNVGQITNLYTDFKLKHNLQSVFTILTHFTILSLTAMMVPL